MKCIANLCVLRLGSVIDRSFIAPLVEANLSIRSPYSEKQMMIAIKAAWYIFKTEKYMKLECFCTKAR